MNAMNEQHSPSPILSTSRLSEKDPTPAPLSEPEHFRRQHGWQMIKQFPLPLVALVLLAISLILWLSGHGDLAKWTLLAIIVIGAVPLLWETIHQFLKKEFGVDVIAILAIGGSLLLDEYLAGALIVLMLSGGEALEAYALRRASSSLSALAERAPRIAHLWSAGVLVNVPAEQVEVGMEVVVKPGELVPVDGVVTAGTSSLSTADLTGEPVPVRAGIGSLVLSGSVNLEGVIEVRATKRSAESQYAQIVRLVGEAQTHKAPIHRLADRYSIGFTIVAVALASLAWLLSRNPIDALAVLVVATPCPLILATPIAIMSGIDLAARHGLIIKSGAALEQLGEVDIAVFDKTGTLTLGMPRVTTVVLAKPEEQETDPQARVLESTDTLCRTGTAGMLLCLAASVEQLSTHILARAVTDAARQCDCPLRYASNFAEVFGKGVSGQVPLLPEDGQVPWLMGKSQVEIAVGNRTFLCQLEIEIPETLLAERERRRSMRQICSFLAVDRQVKGLLVLEDIPRPELAQLSPHLRINGIKEIVLLTGDSEIVANQIGALAQVDRVIARCLPEQKVQTVKDLEQQGHRVLMVGDGINDAPALATATVGMALGSQGLTAAATAADTVLLSTDILRVPRAVHLGRRVLQVALQGIWVGLGLSGVAMIFAALGFIDPAAGALLQEGIDVLVIFNALRVSRIAF